MSRCNHCRMASRVLQRPPTPDLGIAQMRLALDEPSRCNIFPSAHEVAKTWVEDETFHPSRDLRPYRDLAIERSNTIP
jgi:hypothetical protein